MAGDTRESFMASASVPAYGVVAVAAPSGGQQRCQVWATTTTHHIIGVAQDNASTDGVVPVATRHGDICKVICNASVSAGAIVGPTNTLTGAIVERALLTSASTMTIFPRLGIALQSGSTNSVIDVLLQIDNTRTL